MYSRWMAYGMADLISKPAWRYTIGSTPNFGSFRAAKMTPFWDPNFNPPCGQLAVPYGYADREPGLSSKLYTQIKVLGLLSCEPLALPWPVEPCVRMMPILVILAS